MNAHEFGEIREASETVSITRGRRKSTERHLVGQPDTSNTVSFRSGRADYSALTGFEPQMRDKQTLFQPETP